VGLSSPVFGRVASAPRRGARSLLARRCEGPPATAVHVGLYVALHADPTAIPDLAWLARHFGAAGIVLVEADEDTATYAGGHTTGAALLH
jgi:hypothetical protein